MKRQKQVSFTIPSPLPVLVVIVLLIIALIAILTIILILLGMQAENGGFQRRGSG